MSSNFCLWAAAAGCLPWCCYNHVFRRMFQLFTSLLIPIHQPCLKLIHSPFWGRKQVRGPWSAPVLRAIRKALVRSVLTRECFCNEECVSNSFSEAGCGLGHKFCFQNSILFVGFVSASRLRMSAYTLPHHGFSCPSKHGWRRECVKATCANL